LRCALKGRKSPVLARHSRILKPIRTPVVKGGILLFLRFDAAAKIPAVRENYQAAERRRAIMGKMPPWRNISRSAGVSMRAIA